MQNKQEKFGLGMMEETVKQVLGLGSEFYVTVAILLITSLLVFIVIKTLRRKRPNTILLVGLSGSGKTALFYQLRDGSTHQGTVTSMEPNEDCFVLHSESSKKGNINPVHIVDVPGHSRLRPKLDGFLAQAVGVVFVVDALDFLPNSRAAAEYLYDVLTKALVVKRKIPVLIVCNKKDKVTAHSMDFIRKQLEKEIDKLRASRNAISAADIANEVTLGVKGQPFTFSQCINKVTVTEASALRGEISEIEHFIRERIAETWERRKFIWKLVWKMFLDCFQISETSISVFVFTLKKKKMVCAGPTSCFMPSMGPTECGSVQATQGPEQAIIFL